MSFLLNCRGNFKFCPAHGIQMLPCTSSFCLFVLSFSSRALVWVWERGQQYEPQSFQTFVSVCVRENVLPHKTLLRCLICLLALSGLKCLWKLYVMSFPRLTADRLRPETGSLREHALNLSHPLRKLFLKLILLLAQALMLMSKERLDLFQDCRVYSEDPLIVL